MGSSPITAPVEAVCARDHCAKPKCVSVPPEAFLGRNVVHLSSFFRDAKNFCLVLKQRNKKTEKERGKKEEKEKLWFKIMI